jgi:hypothetical protein
LALLRGNAYATNRTVDVMARAIANHPGKAEELQVNSNQ